MPPVYHHRAQDSGGAAGPTTNLAEDAEDIQSCGASSSVVCGGFTFNNSWAGGSVSLRVRRDDDNSQGAGPPASPVFVRQSGASGTDVTEAFFVLFKNTGDAATAADINTVIAANGWTNLTVTVTPATPARWVYWSSGSLDLSPVASATAPPTVGTLSIKSILTISS